MSTSMCDYNLAGYLKAPRTYEQLKTELDRMRKASGKLIRKFEYVTGDKPDQFTVSKLSEICKNLKTSYKKNKTAGTKEEKKERKNDTRRPRTRTRRGKSKRRGRGQRGGGGRRRRGGSMIRGSRTTMPRLA